jgi:hypothetical protein
VHAAARRLADARRAIEASLAIRRATDDRRGEGWMLERLARILHAEGDAAGASEAAAAARAIVAELDDGPLCAALERIEETHDRTTDHSPTG